MYKAELSSPDRVSLIGLLLDSGEGHLQRSYFQSSHFDTGLEKCKNPFVIIFFGPKAIPHMIKCHIFCTTLSL